jgi:hypothetical protein
MAQKGWRKEDGAEIMAQRGWRNEDGAMRMAKLRAYPRTGKMRSMLAIQCWQVEFWNTL